MYIHQLQRVVANSRAVWTFMYIPSCTSAALPYAAWYETTHFDLSSTPWTLREAFYGWRSLEKHGGCSKMKHWGFCRWPIRQVQLHADTKPCRRSIPVSKLWIWLLAYGINQKTSPTTYHNVISLFSIRYTKRTGSNQFASQNWIWLLGSEMFKRVPKMPLT